ncbi:hypothetical protein CW311_11525 [Acinetobacter proteolyticus]|uniref:Uncharacterized protein n=1 Tax=Acinetobacter proteolyticus TaxID=1776741 RepID=A0A2N0WEZ9_9GAMM|nr:hypothetical protein CW311_11525 [Acinetobacter proteolyticus]
MYTFTVEDELANIVKQVAENENRTTRGQFRHFLLIALKNEGFYPQNQSNRVIKTTQNDESIL